MFAEVVQWVVLIFSTASSIFTVNWFVYLYVDNYGKFAQFVNNACTSGQFPYSSLLPDA